MSGVCPYQNPHYTGRNLDDFCYYERDGLVEPFGTNRYTGSWSLSSLAQRDIVQQINSAMRACLDPHISQALGWYTDELPNDGNPLLTGAYDVSCDDTDGLLASNQAQGDTYTLIYNVRANCTTSEHPIAIIKSLINFNEEVGSDLNCLTAEVTRTVVIDTSKAGTSGIINAAAQECIGLITNATEYLSDLAQVNTTYSVDDQCRFLANQTFTPIPSPSSTPSFMPSFNPFPSPFPSSTPSFNPFPSPFPSSTPSFNPSPSPSPITSDDDSPEGHIIKVVAIFFFSAILFTSVVCIWRRMGNRPQVYTGTGPALARKSPDNNPEDLQGEETLLLNPNNSRGFTEIPLK